jgi:hypothetical protein
MEAYAVIPLVVVAVTLIALALVIVLVPDAAPAADERQPADRASSPRLARSA